MEDRRLTTYPKVWDEAETLNRLMRGASLARFGDGEIKLMLGGDQLREPKNKRLQAELLAALNIKLPNYIIGIPTMNPEGLKYVFWHKFEARILSILKKRPEYHSAFITRPDSAPWIMNRTFVECFRSLWFNKRVTLVAEDSKVKIHKVIHDYAKKLTLVRCPHDEAHASIDVLEDRVVASDPEIAILSAGPTATCLVPRLVRRGIQAIDVGSIGGLLLTVFPLKDVEVYGEVQTLDLVLAGASIARFGDGELKILRGHDIDCQPCHKHLRGAFQKIILNQNPEILVGIPRPDKLSPKYEKWMGFMAHYEGWLSRKRPYGSAFITRADSAPWIDTPEYWAKLKQLWEGKHVCLVWGGETASLVPAKVRGTKQLDKIKSRPNNAWKDKDNILNQIRKLQPQPEVVLLCLGPTATALVPDIAAMGIQAVDLGHVGRWM
jgi:hypothetical protein